ncbi:immunity 52 family protein [Hyalangium rubrum]|uniref:Immunity 52 family protein n=1 Tax=Hyalangium rubrum TaxID=3103134 RepID=A0ABU5GXN4_9BACT|nr:immunity 52 family protein [Hyalangium sp. s54d21]MDY7225851.1 immunity 52 family protein [Hyalangium sp. s54d21]
MIETYYVGAYWLGRREPARACAQRAEHFFRLLTRLDPSWSRWFRVKQSREQSLKHPVEPTAATFEAAFAQKKHQLPEHGFRFGIWNVEQQGQSTEIDFTCGSSSRFAVDVCLLQPPDEGAVAERVLTTAMMTEVLRAMVLAWEPDKGVVMSNAHLEKVSPDPSTAPHLLVGWMTYLSRRRGEVPALPQPVRVEPVEDKGSLIILTPERFTLSNPTHVELATRVWERLDQAGLAGPTRPWEE